MDRRPATSVTPAAALAALEPQPNPRALLPRPPTTRRPRRYLGLAAPGDRARWSPTGAPALDVPGRVALAARALGQRRARGAHRRRQAADPGPHPRGRAAGLGRDPALGAGLRRLGDRRPRLQGGERRLVADPARLDTVEAWTTDPNMWVRRAALVATLPWTKLSATRHPSERAARERILGWAAAYVADRDWFIQKAVGWWLRSLSVARPRPGPRVPRRAGHASLQAFARREAERTPLTGASDLGVDQPDADAAHRRADPVEHPELQADPPHVGIDRMGRDAEDVARSTRCSCRAPPTPAPRSPVPTAPAAGRASAAAARRSAGAPSWQTQR